MFFWSLLGACLGLRVELVALGAGTVGGHVFAASEGGLAEFLRPGAVVLRLVLVHVQ